MRIRSRLISGLAIALSVILSSSNVVLATDGSEMIDLEAEVLVEEEFVNPYVWSSDTFQVIHNVTDDWGTGYQSEITIVNIGDTKIEDWNLTFESADIITDIWNASVHFSRPAVSWGGFWIVCDIENDVIIPRNELT